MLLATANATTGSPAFFGQLLLPIAFFAIFYFLIIRPQSKRQKQHRAMIDALAVGNEVVFAGGLMGTIKRLDDTYAAILVGNNELKVQRASVISVLPQGTLANI